MKINLALPLGIISVALISSLTLMNCGGDSSSDDTTSSDTTTSSTSTSSTTSSSSGASVDFANLSDAYSTSYSTTIAKDCSAAGCHGSEGDGPVNLQTYTQNATLAQYIAVVRAGVQSMPPYTTSEYSDADAKNDYDIFKAAGAQ